MEIEKEKSNTRDRKHKIENGKLKIEPENEFKW